MTQVRLLWSRLINSLWFVPSLLVATGAALALALVEVHIMGNSDLDQAWPRVFGVGADGARAMLTAIATSMATVAGVVFSITIVALSLAASQYSPRVLRSFMSDRPTQLVLGSFLAIFTYCLIVLRTIRSGADSVFVPTVAVFVGVLTAFLGVGLLIYFIHHVAVAIQAPFIVERITQDARVAIDRLFPSCVGEPSVPNAQATPDVPPPEWPARLWAGKDAYLIAVDGEGLLQCATHARCVLKVLPRVGDFVHAGEALIQAQGPEVDEAMARRLQRCFSWGSERNVHQDVQYGLQQLVDVALKALSPSTHDPTTAVLCVDYLGALLRQLASRAAVMPWREGKDGAHVWLRGHDFSELVDTALGAITRHAGSHVPVHERLIAAVASAAEAVQGPAKREALARQLRAHRVCLASCALPAAQHDRLASQAGALLTLLDEPGQHLR